MRIELKKFGEVLISRPAGREAWLSAKAYLLRDINAQEKVEVDFSGVLVLSPSWADEFVTPLRQDFGNRVILLPNDNATVKATLETIRC